MMEAATVTKLDIGGGLRAVLKARDVSIRAFAKSIGVNDKSLHEQLKRNRILLASLERWADALEMLPSELLREMELASIKKQVASAQVAAHTATSPHNKRNQTA